MDPNLRRVLRTFLRLEDGTSIVELSVAMSVLSIAVIGLSGAMNLGLSAVGHGRQQAAATALASERIERARNVPYEQLAVDVHPVHDTDPESPDHQVTDESPSRYDVNGDGTLIEPFEVGGTLQHIEDPVTRGATELYAYQYVTWVDDPDLTGTQDYKRVTVIVTWRRALNAGPTHRVEATTFVAEDDILVPQATPTPPGGPSPTPSPTPAPTPAPDSGCDGDVTAPTGTMEVLSGAGAEAGYSSSTVVQVRLEASDACSSLRAEMSNDGSSFTEVAAMQPDVPTTVAWSVPVGDGTKTLYARFLDAAGNVSAAVQGQVTLDQTPPTTPSSFSEVNCTMSGTDRTVTFTWGAAADTNLSGYRVYRSIDDAPYQVVATVSTTSGSDTEKKNHDTVRYFVRSFDRAGNESGNSDVLTYTKNSC